MSQSSSAHNNRQEKPDWRLYERVVAAFVSQNLGVEMSVTPNARIVGCISGIERQLDVLIDARWGDDLSGRIIVDAKRYRSRVDIKDVEAFLSMMEDCKARRGILVCPNGYTEGAKRRAQDALTISILPLEEVYNSTWWASLEECYGECARSASGRKGMVLWDAYHLFDLGGTFMIIATGKCDVCHNFHAWCWDCGEKIALRDEDEYECFCGYKWVTAIEEEVDDPSGDTLNGVHLFVCLENLVFPLDQRRLR